MELFRTLNEVCKKSPSFKYFHERFYNVSAQSACRRCGFLKSSPDANYAPLCFAFVWRRDNFGPARSDFILCSLQGIPLECVCARQEARECVIRCWLGARGSWTRHFSTRTRALCHMSELVLRAGTPLGVEKSDCD